MLRHDQRAAQRDHHQDSQETTEQRHQHYARDLEVQSQNHDRGHRHADAERDRLAGGTRGLNDVVLEDSCVTEANLRKQPEQS